MFLTKGQQAPNDGLLLSIQEANKARASVLAEDGYKKIISLQLTNLDILDKNNQSLAERLSSSNSMNNTERLLWFVGGIVISGLGVWSVQRALH